MKDSENITNEMPVDEMPVTEVPDNNRVGSITENPNGQQKVVDTNNLGLLMDVSMRVTVELGRTRMPLAQILDLQKGSVVELERLAGEPVDVFVNDSLVARGEVVVVDDRFGVRITEMVSTRSIRSTD